jgi:hypothetical protein
LAKKSRGTFEKRQKEKKRQQKQEEKRARRIESKQHKADAEPKSGGQDPDIDGIQPGPQPLPEQWDENSNGDE